MASKYFRNLVSTTLLVPHWVSNEANLYQFLILSDTVISPKVRCFVLYSFCHRTFANFRR